MLIQLKKGLTLPVNGEPEQAIGDSNPVRQVAVLGPDYIGMKPEFAVKVGDTVKLGQQLFSDKKNPAIRYTSPGAGKIVEINRGNKRRFLSIIIDLQGSDERTFKSLSSHQIQSLNRQEIIEQLLESGLWTSLRERPFEKTADPETIPHSIFITALDTNPLAPDVARIIALRKEEFQAGLTVISQLTEGSLFLCKAPNSTIPTEPVERLKAVEFEGSHPAGVVGTHIHFLDPVNLNKAVWHLNAQDVIAIGHLFLTGRLLTERIVALAGPAVRQPRLIKTRLGASVDDLVKNQLRGDQNRIISGSVFHGHHADDKLAFLGRYHQQITVIPEGGQRRLFGWLSPGLNLFSVKNIVLSKLMPGRKLDLNTNLHGGVRSIVPIGSYEKVMPLDILPTFLLRALAVDDIEESEKLGCLELAEEDLALCTFVCPSKIEHGNNLRRVLTLIEKEG